MRVSNSFVLAASAAAAATLAVAGPARAQEDKPVSFSGEATFVSDYRFRGISLSDRDPAVQAGLELSTKPGFFVGLWGSSIAEFNGATAEIDLYGGWTGTFDFLSATLGIIGYLYPGGDDTNYYELYGELGFTLGPAELTVGLNVAPDQGNIARSNRYLVFGASLGVPETPVTLKGSLGFERGGLVPDETGRTSKKTDWLIGADFSFEPLTIGVAYIGNDLPKRFPAVGPRPGPGLPGAPANEIAKNTVVVTLSVGF